MARLVQSFHPRKENSLRRLVVSALGALLLLALPSSAMAAGENLLANHNPGAEFGITTGTDPGPTEWAQSYWCNIRPMECNTPTGTLTVKHSWLTNASEAHTGTHALKVEITAYTDDAG